MPTIHKSSQVPYRAELMYNLVNDIEQYPQFLPWCSEATILERGDQQLTASLTLQTGKIKQSFATRNIMVPGKQIDVSLVRGPFKHLSGCWQFIDVGDEQCRIEYEMNFEFKNRLLKMALSGVFNKIAGSLVDAFTQRAHQLYGR